MGVSDVDGVFRQHRHQAKDQRQLTVVGAGKVKADGQAIERLRLGDLGIILAMVGPTVVAEQLPGK
jgi:hypothetical protein